MNDRIALWACRRFGHGVWKPEYRLHAVWIHGFLFIPGSLALYAAGFQFDLNSISSAVANALFTASVYTTLSSNTTYLIECFIYHPGDAAIVINAYRTLLGMGIPFAISQWLAGVGGAGWVFGTMSLISLATMVILLVVYFYGHRIRRLSFASVIGSEAGTQLLKENIEAMIH